MSSWLDEAGDDDLAALRQPPAVQDLARTWPLFGVLGVSVVGLATAVVRSPRISAGVYVLLLVVGCGLLFFRRYDAIAKTRSAGGAGVLSVQAVEKAAISALALSCLANGIVIAIQVASWPVWEKLP